MDRTYKTMFAVITAAVVIVAAIKTVAPAQDITSLLPLTVQGKVYDALCSENSGFYSAHLKSSGETTVTCRDNKSYVFVLKATK